MNRKEENNDCSNDNSFGCLTLLTTTKNAFIYYSLFVESFFDIFIIAFLDFTQKEQTTKKIIRSSKEEQA